jgi:hypothetical protein
MSTDAARQIVREVTEHPETAPEMAELLQVRQIQTQSDERI